MNGKIIVMCILNLQRLSTFLLLSFLILPSSAQTIRMKANEWQLVSFYELPKAETSHGGTEPGVISVFGSAAVNSGIVSSIWSYNSATRQWEHWSGPVDDDGQPPEDERAMPIIKLADELTSLEYGRGYWIRGKKSGDLKINVPLDKRLASNPVQLKAGWNLVGFPITEPITYNFALAGVEYTQIWRYSHLANTGQGRFESIEKGTGSNANIVEDFNQLEPGKGYWIYSGEEISLEPKLVTYLPADTDNAPFAFRAEGSDVSQPLADWAIGNNDSVIDN